ncbi:MAG: hypothetical protein ABFD07_19645 [Methanobacterium sp.]
MKKKRRANGLKRGPLTAEEKGYLDRNAHKGVEFLANKIRRKPESVSVYLESKNPTPTPPPEPKNNNGNEHLINTMGVHRKGSGVVVMTPAASELSDEIRRARNNDQLKKFRMKKDA